jgi:hypothetical protein
MTINMQNMMIIVQKQVKNYANLYLFSLLKNLSSKGLT